MLFPKKALGVEICSEGIKMALVEGRQNALRLDAYTASALPADAIKFALREQNVLTPSLFVDVIRETYLRLLTKTKHVSVSLPDTTGRVILMDLETRFKSRDEGADIIRWKLKKSFPFNISDAHLDYQLLEEKDSGEISLLVSIIARQVVNQYEDLFVEAGLEPNCIDFTTFNLYRLFSGRLSISENTAFMTFYGGMVTILVFYAGVLSFYRSKEIPGGTLEINRAYREINSSLLVYQDMHPNHTINEVFCVATGDDAEAFRAIVGEATGLEPILLDVNRVVSAKSGLIVDRVTLHSLTAALGAAVRNL